MSASAGRLSVNELLGLFEALRVHHVKREEDLYVVISGLLSERLLPFRREVNLGGVMGRVDYVLECYRPIQRVRMQLDGVLSQVSNEFEPVWVGIEVKHGVIRADEVLSQVQRYLCSALIDELVLVTERGIPGTPSHLMGKPLHQVALHALWGIAL